MNKLKESGLQPQSEENSPQKINFFAAAVIGLVRFYQRNLSPFLGKNCRFTPTCSQYMIEAIRVHGLMKGLLLGIWRILRCNPFGKKGYDPVPAKGCWPKKQKKTTSAFADSRADFGEQAAGADGLSGQEKRKI